MNHTQFYGNTFLFINKNAEEFPLPKESKESFLKYWEKLEEKEGFVKSRIVCNDGFSVSCQAHFGSYCNSRGWENINDITDMELGYPSQRDGLIEMYIAELFADEHPQTVDYTEKVYLSVPLDVVIALINKHGGIKREVDLTMYYEEMEMPSNDTRKQYKCEFVNKDDSEASLCGNALLRLMEQEGVGHYVFHTISGLYDGWNNENEIGLLMKKAKNIQKNNWGEMATIYQMECGNKHEIYLINKVFEKTIYNRCLPNNSKVFNKHFVTQENTNTFEVRCFERGVGETQACGSGAYAVGIAMIKRFKLSEVNIIMKGGKYLVKEGFLIVKK